MLVAESAEVRQEIALHCDEAAFALHGLEHDAGDRGGVDALLEEGLQPPSIVVGAR